MEKLEVEMPAELKSRACSLLLGRVLIRLLKLDILQRYKQTRELSDEEWEFCEKIDWHPVDELQLKDKFVKKLREAEKGPFIRINSLNELFK